MAGGCSGRRGVGDAEQGGRAMRRLARVPLVVLVLASQAAAWNEPETFRGVPWGASEEVAKERIPSICRASNGMGECDFTH